MKWEIINADCKDIIDACLDDNSVIVTDPPFNIGYHYRDFKDNMKENEYLELVGGGVEKSAECISTLSRGYSKVIHVYV